MLYDKRWDKPEVKSDPFSLGSLIAWLETMPADKTYCYTSTSQCLAAQFNKSIGRKYEVVLIRGGKTFEYRLEDIACGSPRTFGAALERARAVLLSPLQEPKT